METLEEFDRWCGDVIKANFEKFDFDGKLDACLHRTSADIFLFFQCSGNFHYVSEGDRLAGRGDRVRQSIPQHLEGFA